MTVTLWVDRNCRRQDVFAETESLRLGSWRMYFIPWPSLFGSLSLLSNWGDMSCFLISYSLRYGLQSPRGQNSNIIYPGPWLNSLKLLAKPYTFSFFIAFYFNIFSQYHSDRKMNSTRGEGSKDRFSFTYKWCSEKKNIFLFFVGFFLLFKANAQSS